MVGSVRLPNSRTVDRAARTSSTALRTTVNRSFSVLASRSSYQLSMLALALAIMELERVAGRSSALKSVMAADRRPTRRITSSCLPSKSSYRVLNSPRACSGVRTISPPLLMLLPALSKNRCVLDSNRWKAGTSSMSPKEEERLVPTASSSPRAARALAREEMSEMGMVFLPVSTTASLKSVRVATSTANSSFRTARSGKG